MTRSTSGPGRSATSPVPYNAASSSGSNYGPLNPGSTKGEGSTAGGAAKSRSRQQGGYPDRPADILRKRARSTYQSCRGRVSGRPDRASSWSGDLGGARADRCEYLRSPMGVPRRACGECGSSQSGIRRKMKYLLFVCVATCLPAQELTDRERMLIDRIENLERRLAVLEKNSGQSAGSGYAGADSCGGKHSGG